MSQKMRECSWRNIWAKERPILLGRPMSLTRNVPAGTLVRSAKCSCRNTYSFGHLSPHLRPSPALVAINAGLAPLSKRLLPLLEQFVGCQWHFVPLITVLVPAGSLACPLGGLSKGIAGLAMGLKSRGPGGWSEFQPPGRSRSGGLGGLVA